MIYHQSSDPVYVKKIYLKVWRLRDELESVLEKKSASGESFDPQTLQEEYSYKGPLTKGGLELIQGGATEEATEAEAAPEESTEEAVEAAPSDEANPEAGTEEVKAPSDEVEIIQRGSEFIPSEKQFKGMTVLSELGMDHMYFFCNHRFIEGQSIVVEFQVPKRFVINAEIVYCRAFNIRSRIISPDRLPYRVAVKFSFLKPGERTLLREFVASVEPKVEQAPKKDVSKPVDAGGGGGGDGFDELDGLDL